MYSQIVRPRFTKPSPRCVGNLALQLHICPGSFHLKTISPSRRFDSKTFEKMEKNNDTVNMNSNLFLYLTRMNVSLKMLLITSLHGLITQIY